MTTLIIIGVVLLLIYYFGTRETTSDPNIPKKYKYIMYGINPQGVIMTEPLHTWIQTPYPQYNEISKIWSNLDPEKRGFYYTIKIEDV